MKKFLLIITFLVSTLTFAHEKTEIEKRKMYDVIQKQLDEGQINVLTAQKMWKAYRECCR
jgi:hypothetical protein